MREVSISTYLMNDLQVFKKFTKSDKTTPKWLPNPLPGAIRQCIEIDTISGNSTGLHGLLEGGRYFRKSLLRQVPIFATRVRGKQGRPMDTLRSIFLFYEFYVWFGNPPGIHFGDIFVIFLWFGLPKWETVFRPSFWWSWAGNTAWMRWLYVLETL